MTFLNYYNWLKYSFLPPSFFFKNRLFIERNLKNKYIFTPFEYNQKSFDWLFFSNRSLSEFNYLSNRRKFLLYLVILFIFLFVCSIIKTPTVPFTPLIMFFNFIHYTLWRFLDYFYFWILNFIYLIITLALSWVLYFMSSILPASFNINSLFIKYFTSSDFHKNNNNLLTSNNNYEWINSYNDLPFSYYLNDLSTQNKILFKDMFRNSPFTYFNFNRKFFKFLFYFNNNDKLSLKTSTNTTDLFLNFLKLNTRPYSSYFSSSDINTNNLSSIFISKNFNIDYLNLNNEFFITSDFQSLLTKMSSVFKLNKWYLNNFNISNSDVLFVNNLTSFSNIFFTNITNFDLKYLETSFEFLLKRQVYLNSRTFESIFNIYKVQNITDFGSNSLSNLYQHDLFRLNLYSTFSNILNSSNYDITTLTGLAKSPSQLKNYEISFFFGGDFSTLAYLFLNNHRYFCYFSSDLYLNSIEYTSINLLNYENANYVNFFN